MNAWASLSCLCITFWQVSIYSSAACMQKGLFYIKKRHLLESIPSEAFFQSSFHSRWALLCPGCQQIPPSCSGAGEEQDVMALEAGAALGEPAQVLHKSGCHLCIERQWFCTCCSALEGHRETGLSPPLSSSPSLSLFLFFIFNYFLISEEKEICGRKQF